MHKVKWLRSHSRLELPEWLLRRAIGPPIQEFVVLGGRHAGQSFPDECHGRLTIDGHCYWRTVIHAPGGVLMNVWLPDGRRVAELKLPVLMTSAPKAGTLTELADTL